MAFSLQHFRLDNKAVVAKITVGPLPDDLVGAQLLLCSDDGAWINGQVINTDGGRVLRLCVWQ